MFYTFWCCILTILFMAHIYYFGKLERKVDLLEAQLDTVLKFINN